MLQMPVFQLLLAGCGHEKVGDDQQQNGGHFWIRSGCKRLGCQFAGHVQGRGEIGSMMDPVGLRSQPKAFEH